MNRVCKTAVFTLITLAVSGQASSQEVFIYPQKGQSAEQQDKDKYECYGWAKDNSGFDPMAAPATSTAPPRTEEKSHGLLKGAAVGARETDARPLFDSSTLSRR